MSNVPFFYQNQDEKSKRRKCFYSDGDGQTIKRFISKISSAARKNHYSQIHRHTANLTVRRKPFQMRDSKSVCGQFTVYFQPSVWISFDDLPVFTSDTTAECVPMCSLNLKPLIFGRLIKALATLFQESAVLNSAPKTQAVYPKTTNRKQEFLFARPCAAFTPQLPAFTLYIAPRQILTQTQVLPFEVLQSF